MSLRLSEHPERDRPRERLWSVGPAPGVGRGKAARVVAALELGRRVGAEEEPPPERIRGPADVQRFYASRLRDLAVEEFHVLALGSQSQVLGDLLITRSRNREA